MRPTVNAYYCYDSNNIVYSDGGYNAIIVPRTEENFNALKALNPCYLANLGDLVGRILSREISKAPAAEKSTHLKLGGWNHGNYLVKFGDCFYNGNLIKESLKSAGLFYQGKKPQKMEAGIFECDEEKRKDLYLKAGGIQVVVLQHLPPKNIDEFFWEKQADFTIKPAAKKQTIDGQLDIKKYKDYAISTGLVKIGGEKYTILPAKNDNGELTGEICICNSGVTIVVNRQNPYYNQLMECCPKNCSFTPSKMEGEKQAVQFNGNSCKLHFADEKATITLKSGKSVDPQNYNLVKTLLCLTSKDMQEFDGYFVKGNLLCYKAEELGCLLCYKATEYGYCIISPKQSVKFDY